MIVLGVDPGLHGGIAVLDRWTGTATVYPMPLLPPSPNGRDDYDVPQILRLLSIALYRPERLVVVEKMRSLPSMFRAKGGELKHAGGSIANYNRGGSWQGFRFGLTALGIPFEPVYPQVWQKAMLDPGSGDTKTRSILAAQRLFPTTSLLPTARSRKPSDGLSDALLIAEWGRRKLAGGDLFAQREKEASGAL